LKGIIVGGFSGTGKSTLVRAVINEVRKDLPSIQSKIISSINLLSKVVGGA
jgi:hypothetical protein